MYRDTYTSIMAAGIHRMRKIAERQQLDKRAFDFNEASSKAMEWLKNNWGKAGGTGLLALLGYGLGHKALGPLGGLLGLAAGGAGGWFGGDWLQNKYEENRQNAWQSAYDKAYNENRVRLKSPSLLPTSSKWVNIQPKIWQPVSRFMARHDPLMRAWDRGVGKLNNRRMNKWNQAQGQQDALARQKASEIATSTTGWDPNKQQGVTP